jgi:hypothetical protein
MKKAIFCTLILCASVSPAFVTADSEQKQTEETKDEKGGQSESSTESKSETSK